jgi:hypothetical protein
VEELAGREAELRPADLPKVNLKGIEELVTDKGYHSGAVVTRIKHRSRTRHFKADWMILGLGLTPTMRRKSPGQSPVGTRSVHYPEKSAPKLRHSLFECLDCGFSERISVFIRLGIPLEGLIVTLGYSESLLI